MREIKFRGKRACIPEWVYGDLVYSDQKNVFIIEKTRYRSYSIKCGAAENYKVIPKTVGQYTGLKDVNGRKIYEGDILGDDNDVFAVVVWVKEGARFGLQFDGQIDTNRMTITDWFDTWKYTDWKVIGNIYDNPELLEVQK